MSAISFADAQKTVATVSAKVNDTTATAFDPSLKYNRVIQPAGGKNKFPTRSIDSGELLKQLDKENIDKVKRITLACSYNRDGLLMWDAHTNLMSIAGTASCIFLANSDFSPVGLERTVSSSQFLNYNLPGARLRLNKVLIGDKVGIGIYNRVKRTSFILIYEVKSNCVVQDTKDNRDERPTLIHGINCELLQVYRFNERGEGDLVSLQGIDEDHDHTLQAFVSYLLNTVMDITNSYPWKAHFLPVNVKAWNRDELETRLGSEFTDVELTDYDTFEHACRSVYNEARASKIAALKRTDRRINTRGNKKQTEAAPVEKPKNPSVPVVEITTLNDSGIILARLVDENTGSVELFKFEKNSMADVCVTESFLTNADIEGANLVENTNVLELTTTVFNEPAVTRYFTANF